MYKYVYNTNLRKHIPIRYCMAYQKEKSWRKLKFKKNKKELHKQI